MKLRINWLLIFFILLIIAFKLINKSIFQNIILINIIFFFAIFLLFLFFTKKLSLIFKKDYMKNKKSYFFIFAIIIFLAIAHFILPHTHSFVPDDYWLMEQGKNLILKGEPVNCYVNTDLTSFCTINKTIGFPAIISLFFMMFGLSNYIAFFFVSLFSIVNVFLIFVILRLILPKNKILAFIGVLFLISSTRYLRSSLHVENVILGITFVLLSTIGFIIFFQKKNKDFFLLGTFSLILSFFIRSEFALFLIPLVVALLMKKNDIRRFINPLALGFFLVLLAFVLMLFQQQVTETTTLSLLNSDIYKFSLENFEKNFLFFNEIFGIKLFVFFALSLIGVSLSLFRKKTFLLFLLSAFPLFLFYFSLASPHILETTLLLFVIMIPYLVLAIDFFQTLISNFLSKEKYYFVIIVFFIFLISSSVINNSITKEDSLSALNVHFPNIIRDKVPKDCYLITERPSFANSVADIEVLKTLDVFSNQFYFNDLLKSETCILFFQNEFCYRNLDVGPGRDEFARSSKDRCNFFKKNYNLDDIYSLSKEPFTYKISRVSFK